MGLALEAGVASSRLLLPGDAGSTRLMAVTALDLNCPCIFYVLHCKSGSSIGFVCTYTTIKLDKTNIKFAWYGAFSIIALYKSFEGTIPGKEKTAYRKARIFISDPPHIHQGFMIENTISI